MHAYVHTSKEKRKNDRKHEIHIDSRWMDQSIEVEIEIEIEIEMQSSANGDRDRDRER